MLNVIVVALMGAIFFAALFGWGRLVEFIFRVRWPFPFTVCLGMSCLIFLGGILNLVGIAYAPVLDILILFGLGFSAIVFFRSKGSKPFPEFKKQYLSGKIGVSFLLSALLIVTVFAYSALTLSSQRQFNFHDDFEKYMNHPLRMLATGTLKSGPFDVIGGDTFGGQAFLQGFFVAHVPISYVNTVDTVFAFTLFLAALLAVAIRARLPFWLIPLVVLTPIFLNPQSVNISACYTASVFLLFIFLGTWVGIQDPDNPLPPWPNAGCLGLTYAALIILKTSYLFPALVHFALLSLGFIYLSRSWKAMTVWASKVIAFVSLFSLPWVLLSFPRLLASFANMNTSDDSILRDTYFGYAEPVSNLFSLKPLSYGFGTSFVFYTAIVIFVGTCSVLFLIGEKSGLQVDKFRRVSAFAACATLPVLYSVGTILTAQMFFGQEHALRFICPVLIAAVPTSLILLQSVAKDLRSQMDPRNSLFITKNAIVACISILLLSVFFESFFNRIKQAKQYGSPLSFSKLVKDSGFIEYNRFALSSEAKKKVQKAQQVVPENASIAAWTPLAFHLDYNRNDILSINPSGLVSPWQDFPFGKRVDQGVLYLNDLNVFYVLWHYRGYAVRSSGDLKALASVPFFRDHAIGIRSIQFVTFLKNVAKRSQIIYNDGEILVMKLSDSSTPID